MARSIRASLAALALVCACIATHASARADQQIVYWPLVTNASEYRRIPYPREAGPLLVLADTEVVIEARRAEVAFWPITREYLTDLSGTPDLVPGTVEVVDASGKVSAPQPEPYVLWYRSGVGAGPSELLRGAEATARYEEYVATARAAAAKALSYQRIVAELNMAVETWARMAADNPANPPPPPPELTIEEPEPYQAFATEPREAPVFSLPPGTYAVRLRAPGGEIIAGSERTLVSFAALGSAAGYVLRPADRWTRPLTTFAPGEAIYTTGGTDLYFEPVPVVEFEAARFARLFHPQSVDVIDPALTVWVRDAAAGGAGDDIALEVWDGGAKVETLAPVPYRVVQKAGNSRGYVIEEFSQGGASPLAPDFTAVRVASDRQVSAISPAGDRTGVRAIRRVTPAPEYLLYLPALLPLAVGACMTAIARGTSARRAGRARRKG